MMIFYFLTSKTTFSTMRNNPPDQKEHTFFLVGVKKQISSKRLFSYLSNQNNSATL